MVNFNYCSRASAERLLELARQYWSIKNGTHHRLDVCGGEDRCRVRDPAAATTLGILRRAAQGEYRAWSTRQRKARDITCPAFQEKMSLRINLVVRYLSGEVSSVRAARLAAGSSPKNTCTKAQQLA